MKHTLRNKALSTVLAVLMLVSAFAMAVPASAAEPLVKAPEILWSADFDYAEDVAAGANTQGVLANPTNGDGKLPLWTGTLAGTGISAQITNGALKFNGGTIYNDYDPSKDADYNKFFDLMYGRTEYTSYYMEMDFTHSGKEQATNPTYLYQKGTDSNNALVISGKSDAEIAAMYNFDKDNDGVNDTFVNYKVESSRRGPSYFTIQQGEPGKGTAYNELFKISPEGYIYAPGGTSGGINVSYKSGVSANSINDWSKFNYVKYEAVKVKNETTEYWEWKNVEADTLSAEVVDSMGAAKGGDFTLSWSSALIDYSKAYKLEAGVNYKLRIEFSVDKDAKKVTYTTYIRENGDNSPFFKVGQRTLNTLFGTSGTRGTDFPWAVRVVEINSGHPAVDNWFFATFPEDCSNGHIRPVIQSEYKLEGYKNVYSVKCLDCNQQYWTYDSKSDYLFDNDFTTMTQGEFDAWVSKYNVRNAQFTEGEGIKNLVNGNNGEGIWISDHLGGTGTGKAVINDTKPYEIGFTINFQGFPNTSGTNGASFFTDLTEGWDMLLRFGTHNIDGVLTTEASTTKAWLKMRDIKQNIAWENAEKTPYCTYLELNKDYEFVIKIDGNDYSVYITPEGGEQFLLGHGAAPLTGPDNKAYRIGDSKANLKFTVKNWYIVNENESDIEIYDIFDETMGYGYTFEYSNLVPKVSKEAGLVFGNSVTGDTYGSSVEFARDKQLTAAQGSVAISFDFMVSGDGRMSTEAEYEKLENKGNQFWSMLSCLTKNDKPSATSYGAMLSLGGLDNNGDGKFDKYIITTGMAGSGDNNLVSENTGYQSITVGGNTKYYSDKNAIAELEVGEWVNVAIVFDALADMSHIYVNGELAAIDYEKGATTFANTSDYNISDIQFRFFDGFRRFKYDYALRNVEIVPYVDYLQSHAGTAAYVNDFGSADRRVNMTRASVNDNPHFGDNTQLQGITKDPTIGGVTYSQVLDTETEQGYTRFVALNNIKSVINGTTRLFDLVKSVKNRFTKEYVDLLSADGGKYVIDVKFAVPDRALSEAEITDAKSKWSDFEGTTTIDLLANSQATLIRLSKWNDNNAVRLVYYDATGIFSSIGSSNLRWYYCDKDGNLFKDYISELDESGRPLNMTDVKVVVDEWNNTFTTYINGAIAYVKRDQEIKKAVDLEMYIGYDANSLVGSTSGYNAGGKYADYADYYQDAPEYKAWVESGKAYAAIPHHLTVHRPVGGGVEVPVPENVDPSTLTNPTAIVSNVAGKAGDTVEVTLSLANNPGIITILPEIEYNSDVLEIVSVTSAGNLGGSTINNKAEALVNNPYKFTLGNDESEEDYIVNGTVATIKLKIKDGAAAGKYDVKLTLNAKNTVNFDLDEIDFDVISGSVVVGSDAPVEYEDVVVNHNNNSGNNNMSFIRFFQSAYDFVLESIEIDAISDSDVEYIGSQVKASKNDKFDLRFIFGINDLYADGITYHVTAEKDAEGIANAGVETDMDDKVYSSILADGKQINAYEYIEGNYFSVFTVKDVEVATADTLYTFTITPYVTDALGNKTATGEVYTVQYNGLGEYVGCAVSE